MESVRLAGAGDLDRCAELLERAGVEAVSVRGGDLLAALADSWPDGIDQRVPPTPEQLIAAWTRAGSAHRLLVGTYEGVTVGAALGSIRTGRRKAGRVEWCYVEPDARGVGVGTALADALVDWFTVCGCSDVDALVLPGDRPSKSLFEASGFKARLLVLHRQLG